MADLENISTETLEFSPVVGAGVAQAFAEALAVRAFYPATPFFLAADLGVYSRALDRDQAVEFMRTRSPIGYAPFRDFVASEYKFRRAYVQFAFAPLDGSDAQLSLDEARVFADVPDRTENNQGTVTNATTGLSVTFSRAFSAAPKVTITPISTTAVVAVLTALATTTGFTVKLFDLSGNAVTGSFFWTASGY
jgi:hypothetical protein